MRKAPVGSIYQALRAALSAAGGLEPAANDLGLSPALLSRATNPHEEHHRAGLGSNHLDTLCRIVPAAAVPIAEHFARLAGGVFSAADVTASDNIHALVKEFGDVLKHHGKALSEGSKDPAGFTPDEAAQALKEVKDLSAVLSAYRKHLEGCLPSISKLPYGQKIS